MPFWYSSSESFISLTKALLASASLPSVMPSFTWARDRSKYTFLQGLWFDQVAWLPYSTNTKAGSPLWRIQAAHSLPHSNAPLQCQWERNPLTGYFVSEVLSQWLAFLLTWTLSIPKTSALFPLIVTVHWLRHLPFQKFLGLYWWSSMQTTILLPACKKDWVNTQQSLKCYLFGENSRDSMIVVVFDIAGDVRLNDWPETFYSCTVSGPWLKIGCLFAKVVVLERLLRPWNHNKKWVKPLADYTWGQKIFPHRVHCGQSQVL